ncbi:MAG: hypothetical protein AAF705_06865 [Bacteroidota bacterium]
MNELIELIGIVNKHKVKQIEIVGNLSKRKTKVQEFMMHFVRAK